jgi:hypothetical protein
LLGCVVVFIGASAIPSWGKGASSFLGVPNKAESRVFPWSQSIIFNETVGIHKNLLIKQIVGTRPFHYDVEATYGVGRDGVLIPMKVVGDSDLILVTGSEVKPIIFGAKRRWHSYRA